MYTFLRYTTISVWKTLYADTIIYTHIIKCNSQLAFAVGMNQNEIFRNNYLKTIAFTSASIQDWIFVHLQTLISWKQIEQVQRFRST